MRARFPSMLTAMLIMAATGRAADRPYLPAVGPPPLRFAQPAPPPPAVAVALPPLPPATVAVTPESTATNAATRALGESITTSVAASAAPANLSPGSVTGGKPSSSAAVPLVAPAPGGDVVAGAVPDGLYPLVLPGGVAPPLSMELLTPQLFMKYFSMHPGTNAGGVSVMTPVTFIPPQLPLAPSSSASFETTPPGKP